MLPSAGRAGTLAAQSVHRVHASFLLTRTNLFPSLYPLAPQRRRLCTKVCICALSASVALMVSKTAAGRRWQESLSIYDANFNWDKYITQPHNLAPFVPMPSSIVDRALDMLELRAEDVFLDLGCGLGKVMTCGPFITPTQCNQNELTAGVDRSSPGWR